MSRLSLRTLKRKKLPFGKFSFLVLLRRDIHHASRASSNAGSIEEMRKILNASCKDGHKFIYYENYKGKRVYDKLYLKNPMDVAMLKMVHQDQIYKIYKIIVDPTV